MAVGRRQRRGDRVTINGSSMAAPADFLFGRMIMSRGFSLSDYGTAYRSGYTDGGVDGIGRGLAVADSRAQQDIEEAYEEGAAAGFPAAFNAGTASAPGPETTPPTLGTSTPTPGSTPGTAGAFPATWNDAKDVAITIPVIDAESVVGFVSLSVHYGDLVPPPGEAFGVWETVYAGRPVIDGNAGFREGYSESSAVTGSGAPGVGFTFNVRRDGSWPQRNGLALPITIDTKAVDTKGNVLA